jgi:hypothetical protein
MLHYTNAVGTSHAVSGLGARLALVAGSLAAGGLGWFVAQQFGDDEPTATALAATDFYDCSITTDTATAKSVGQVHAGDRVWLIGTTQNQWAVIRNPDHPDRPAWLPLALVDTNAPTAALPQLTCAEAITTATTVVTDTGPATTLGQGVPSTVVLETTTTESSTTSSTSTTLPSDVTPPLVAVASDRAWLYTLTGRAPCNAETSLEVTISIADPSLPLTIRSIVATWTSPAGPQTANLVPVAGNRFSLQVPTNGPAGGETPLTLTATASDGVGNVGTGQLVVSLRDPASFGCA